MIEKTGEVFKGNIQTTCFQILGLEYEEEPLAEAHFLMAHKIPLFQFICT